MTIVCVDDLPVMLKGIKQSVEQILPDQALQPSRMPMMRLYGGAETEW